MTFLPIAERELRVAARRPGTYWGRFMFGLIAVIVVGAVLIAQLYSKRTFMAGRELFQMFAGFGVFYCMFVGAGRTCDCLSVEKRDGTLGFLFLTDLKGYDIVLGKLLAGLIETVFGLMTVFPVLAVVLLMGGVQLGELAGACLALINVLWFSGALGVLISSMSRNQQHASMMGGLLAAFFLWGVPALSEVVSSYRPGHWSVTALQMLSPVMPLQGSMRLPSRGFAGDYWLALFVSHALSWVCLGIAAWIIPRTWQEKPARTGRNLTWHQRWQQWTYGHGEGRVLRRRRLLECAPFLWLTMRNRLLTLWPWVGLAFIAIVITVVVLLANQGRFNPVALVITSGAWYMTVKLGVAGAASQRLAEERGAGTLELLLSTPLQVRDIARGQWIALERQFLWPALATTALIGVSTVVCAFFWDPVNLGDRLQILATGLAAEIMFIADLAALGWAGMWFGLAAKDAKQASASAYTSVMMLPNVATGLWSAGVVAVCEYFRWRVPGFPFFLASWFVFGVVNSVWQFTLCRRHFYSRIREIAASRYLPPQANFWAKVGRRLGSLLRPATRASVARK